MDTIKIGNFLAELRKEQGLTQEALGEKLDVTNKTVSRWENGNYLPPVEMLQELSKLYAVSINEILCGERITEENYQAKAEETITGILSGSPFSFKERSDFWKRKWKKDHFISNLVLGLAVLVLFVASFHFSVLPLMIATPFAALLLYMKRNNDMMTYVENNLYRPIQK